MKESNQINYFEKIVKILKELKKDYPTSTLGKHIALAMYDYQDVFSVTDREFSFALEKYQAELEINTVSDKEIEDIERTTEELFKEVDRDYEYKLLNTDEDEFENQ